MLNVRSLLRYGLFGLPLAFAGLPIYVHVPKFYADILHLKLATLGVLLLVLRLCDAVLDPLIGRVCDRFYRHTRIIMATSVPILALSYAALFAPPAWGMAHPTIWLAVTLAFVYASFSTLMINYYARGVDMAAVYHDHTKIAAYREGFVLLGVLLASIMPVLLMQHFDARHAYSMFGILLAPLLIGCAIYSLSDGRVVTTRSASTKGSVAGLLAMPELRWVLLVGFCNSVPTAITSTLFLFFTTDILQAGDQAGLLLALYFLSAACGMPVWARVSRYLGKKPTLRIAMAAAIVAFLWAAMLGAGDIVSFAVICVLSGLTLGADSMLLPALLGDVLKERDGSTATGFGLWNFTTKLTMAVAAGVVLPLLALGGYHSAAHNDASSLRALSLCYAVLPCIIKAFALILLSLSPLDRRRPKNV